MKKKYLLALLLCFSTLGMNAQIGKFYNTDRQLSSSLINNIFQDCDGRIWIGTHNGLNAYDGYQFRTYKKDGRNGLKGNYVNVITQTRDRKLYIGLNNALQFYDGDKFHDISLRNSKGHDIPVNVTSVCQTRKGTVYVGTSGRGIFQVFNHEYATSFVSHGTDLFYIQRILEDRSGTLWIMTQDKGIFALKGKTLRHVDTGEAPQNSLMDILQDKSGNIYVSSINSGLFRLQTSNYSLQHITSSGNLPIVSLCLDHKGDILLGTNGNGMYIYNPKYDYAMPNTFFSNEVDLSHGKVYSLIEDNSGNVWMGLLQKGVFMQPFRQTNFGYIGYKNGSSDIIGDACVMCAKYGKDGTLWVATDNNGLYAIDRNHHLLKHFAPGKGEMSVPSTILGISEDNDGRLWVGSFLGGCGWVDTRSGTYHRLPCTYGKASSVFDVLVDRHNILWIGTLGDGLKRVNLETNEVKEYRNSTTTANTISNDYIAQLYLSNDGRRLYVGTSTGLCCLNLANDSWISTFGRNQVIESKAIFDMKEDDKGNIWVGVSDGLYRVNLKNRQTKIFTENDGLADNCIASIEMDSRSRIWLGTGHGLSCMNLNNGKIINYYVGDGLQNNEFSEGVSCSGDHGILAFGGIGGVTIFNPLKVMQKNRSLHIYISDFNVGGEPVVAGMKSGGYTITDTSVMETETFDLNYQDNSFSLNISTLTYDNPERIYYLYSINGEEWVKMPQGKNEITFSHLLPGTYKFRIKAMDNDLESDIKSFTVVIHPAWYFSWWAKTIYALIAVLIVLWYLRMRQRKERDNLRLQEHIHAEELSESKLRFFMNISHEIRTPMTLIVAPLLTLMKEDHDAHRYGSYEIIKRNAERILHLVNQMMDLRKIDKGQMMMRMVETNIIEFTADVYSLFEPQSKTKDITFTYEHDVDNILVWIDRGNFDKVLMNILSNAFKFTPAGGKITISVHQDDGLVVLAVSDDGEKIPDDKLDKIFERFYQTASATNERQAGTGIGLDLTRSLVELHHGTIKARNNESGKGCTFVVTLPLGCAHLKPEEMIAEETGGNEPLYGISLEDDYIGTEPIEHKPPVVTMNKKRPLIIIAEDDSEICQYLNSELEAEYRIIVCSNGKEALAAVLKEIPALVISDIMMPEMDGNTLCTKIKSNVNTNQIPVILLTAKNRDDDKLEGLETGADAYIMKPFNMDILRRTIINLINVRNTLRNKFSGNESQTAKVETIQMKSPDEKLLERVMAVINKNLTNTDLNIDMIAEEVGISRVHLHRKMKELTNQTPHDLVRNIRLKQAANLLANQHQNITEVMFACGFSNAASFSTMFKNMYGVSPKEYMKENAD